MKKSTLLLVCCLMLTSIAISQNLVPNPGFENYSSLPNGYGQFYKAIGWTNLSGVITGPPYASPDYFHTAGSVGTYFGQLPPNSGQAQMGFYTYLLSLGDAREYLATQLTAPLIPGNQYQLSFYLTSGTGSGAYQAQVDNFGIHLSDNQLVQFVDEVIPLTPTFEIPGTLWLPGSWQLFTFTFTATSPAQHITFGNFEYDATTTNAATNGNSYYFIDDIELIALTNNIQIQGDSTICAGDSTMLMATNGGSTYAWAVSTTPGQIFSNDSTITVAPTTTTTYFVYGSSDTASFTVTVNSLPIVALGADTTLCQGETLLLDATTAGATYVWQDNSVNPTFNVTQAGSYYVAVTTNGCTAIDTINVAFIPSPQITLGADTTLCAGQSVLLDVTTSGGTYVWQDNSTNATFNVTQSGIYSVAVTVGTCTTTDSISVTFVPQPVVTLGADTTLCLGNTLVLNAATAGGSYLWQDNSTNATFNVTQSGTYYVQVSVGNCTATDTINVTFTAPPVVSLGADTTLCAGQSLTLDATTTGGTYQWQDNSTASTFTVTQSGLYSVAVTVNNCTASDAINVTFIPLPVVSLGQDTSVCAGNSITLDATTPNATYQWQNGTTSPTFVATQPGTYTVTVTSNNCSAEDDIQLSFIAIPVPELGADTILCIGESITFDATWPNATYVWYDNSTSSSLMVNQSGTYWVDVTVEGCSASDTVTVALEDCQVILTLPNIFTPNFDGKNDLLIPIETRGVVTMNTKIFNRYGQLVHESNSLQIEWKGTTDSGDQATDGTYFYIVTYTDRNGKGYDLSGHVLLAR